jgi:3-hydroxybutyryl-CoA dehydrogenase
MQIESVLIAGAGWVGRQIAARMAFRGLEITLLDKDPSALSSSLEWISTQAVIATEGGIERMEDWENSIQAIEDLDQLADPASIDLALECAPEQLSIKRRLLKKLSETFGEPTIIASNSSYFVPSLFSPYLVHPERYAHVHFHVPVMHDSVSDICGHKGTDEMVLKSLKVLVERLGLEPLMLRKEHPGYVFNWMLQSLLKSALELVASDVVDVKDVDLSWQKVTGMPIGPFGIMDQIGIDVVEQVMANSRWADELPDQSERILQLLREKTKAGKLGTKTGEGFYMHSSEHELQ